MSRPLSTAIRSTILLGSVAALSATLLFVGGEVLIRYREWRRDTVPGTLPLIFYRHSRFPLGLTRGTEYFGWVNINRHGFRGPEVDVAREPGTVRPGRPSGDRSAETLPNSRTSPGHPCCAGRWRGSRTRGSPRPAN